MPRIVSASEAKNRFGAILKAVVEQADEIIVESRGEETAAIISIAEYREYRELREKARRAELLARVRAIRERTLAQNADLTSEQAEDLANRFSREFVEGLAKAGKIRFSE